MDDIEAGSTRIKNGQVGRDRDGDGGREGGKGASLIKVKFSPYKPKIF